MSLSLSLKKVLAVVFSKTFFLILLLVNILIAILSKVIENQLFIDYSVYIIWGALGLVFFYAFCYGVYNMFKSDL